MTQFYFYLDKRMTWRELNEDNSEVFSPLLYIYKNAVLEENKKTNECRDMLRKLNKKGIPIHVPWSTSTHRCMLLFP